MRVYIPATLHLVAGLVAAGQTTAPVGAYAVTAALRYWVEQDGPADDEELELVALGEAARASLRLLALQPDTPRCRVVLAADVPDPVARVEDHSDLFEPGQVTLTTPVPQPWLRAVHIDEAAAADDVAAAAAAVTEADDGDAAAESVVGLAAARELLWYAPAELASVTATLS